MKIKVLAKWTEKGPVLSSEVVLPAYSKTVFDIKKLAPKPPGTLEMIDADVSFVCLNCGFKADTLEGFKHKCSKGVKA